MNSKNEKIKIWVDDVRPAPEDYIWCKSTGQSLLAIHTNANNITMIDLDHNAGDYVFDGGDYIKILDWLEEKGLNYPIRIHSINPVGRENMRKIIRKNGWKEVL